MFLIKSPQGIFAAIRNGGEPPFAHLYPPSKVSKETGRKSRTWGIKYRGSDTFNSHPRTERDGVYELERMTEICNSHQLGL